MELWYENAQGLRCGGGVKKQTNKQANNQKPTREKKKKGFGFGSADITGANSFFDSLVAANLVNNIFSICLSSYGFVLCCGEWGRQPKLK